MHQRGIGPGHLLAARESGGIIDRAEHQAGGKGRGQRRAPPARSARAVEEGDGREVRQEEGDAERQHRAQRQRRRGVDPVVDVVGIDRRHQRDQHHARHKLAEGVRRTKPPVGQVDGEPGHRQDQVADRQHRLLHHDGRGRQIEQRIGIEVGGLHQRRQKHHRQQKPGGHQGRKSQPLAQILDLAAIGAFLGRPGRVLGPAQAIGPFIGLQRRHRRAQCPVLK
ncbi:MAG: hypothetical protein H6924_02700 [Alphaproteobacteria bacterium]|nr:hypothetical protein [Alphaproteobacteria bacterium]